MDWWRESEVSTVESCGELVRRELSAIAQADGERPPGTDARRHTAIYPAHGDGSLCENLARAIFGYLPELAEAHYRFTRALETDPRSAFDAIVASHPGAKEFLDAFVGIASGQVAEFAKNSDLAAHPSEDFASSATATTANVVSWTFSRS